MEWSEIRDEFACGSMTLAELAKKYGCSSKTLYKRAERENWSALREEFRRETGEKAMKRAEARAARAHAKSLERLVETSLLQEELIYEAMRAQNLRPRQILQLSMALDCAVKTRRNLMGLPTQAEKMDQKIKKERLELDKRKADAGEAGASDGMTVEIKTPEGMDAEEISG